ncbi:MAG: mechanosensitive ion channel protein MscS [Peredibacter sp.]|nr:mechanosensitive ion channel protein MscS [Peredibacter sp.]|tara:strand:- start:457 stop:1380 length:924 start_codon:yes stop_codon:yes gene_type:complete
MDWSRLDITNASKILINKIEGWIEGFIAGLPNFIVAIVVILLSFLIAKGVRKLSSKLVDKVTHNKAVGRLLQTLIYLTVVFSGIFVALGILNLDKTVTSLLAGAGVIGLALGFAFQEIAANFIAGILIAFRKPFSIGDLVEMGQYYGKVTNMNMRTTTITTLQGLDAIIPNKKMFTEAFMNYTSNNERRMDLGVGVSYGDDLEKVEEVTISCLEKIEDRDTSKDIEFFYTDFGASSINFDVRVWLKFREEKDFLRIRHKAVKEIKKAFDDNDIDIPFPIRTLNFDIRGGKDLAHSLDEAKKLNDVAH